MPVPLRRSLVAALAAVALALGSSTAATAAPSRPSPVRDQQWLLVADAVAHEVYVEGVQSGRQVAAFGGVTFGTHAGTVQLGHGEVAFMDESKPQLDVLRIDPAGRARITERYPIGNADGRWVRAGWISTDVTHRYIAVGSDFDDPEQQVTLIDRRTRRAVDAAITVSEVRLATTGQQGVEEMETFLTGRPLRLVVTAGGHLDAYDATRILRGSRTPSPVASTPFGPYPHGPIEDATGTAVGSTTATGQQTVRVTSRGFGRSTISTYPEDAVESYRPRLAADGTTAVGVQAGRTAAGTSWNAVPQYVTSGSTARSGLVSVGIGTGLATRVAVGRDFAAAAVTSAYGDRLVLVQAARRGAFTGYQRSLALVPLQAGPKPGAPTAGTAMRFTAATPDGRAVFVTRGQEGAISQIAIGPRGLHLQRTITTPTALADGGYLAVIDPHARPTDLIGR